MKTLIFILITLSFLQTTVLSLDLVLIILVCRAWIKDDNLNLYLAFSFGLLISHLSLTTLGLYSLLFLLVLEFVKAFSRTRFSSNPLFIMPVVFVLMLLNNTVSSFISGQLFIFNSKIIFESLLSLPIFFIYRLWEERFIVRRDIKLRV